MKARTVSSPVVAETKLRVIRTDLPYLKIEANRGWVSLQLKEVWKYRELLYFLAARDMKVRYKQTALGALWAILQPLLTMVVFSIFFGKLAKLPSDGIPYPLFSLAALLPWSFFAQSLAQSSNSLVSSSNLIKKVYFPRLIIPIASVLAGLVDFLISSSLLLGMMVYYGRYPTIQILWTIPLFLLTMVTALGVGLWLSALNVRYRDVRYTLPFLTQFWLFATPVAYSSQLLSEPFRTLYAINPMVGVVEGFRFALFGVETRPGAMVFLSSLVSIFILVSGAYYFRNLEKTFADKV